MATALIIALLVSGTLIIDTTGQQSVCSVPKSPQNGKVNCVNDRNELKCYATCNSGFAFRNASVEFRTCNHGDGTWSTGNIFPDCFDAFLVKSCRPIDAPAHGSVSCAYSYTELTCTASCDTGFKFEVIHVPINGKVSLMCSTTKSWPNVVSFPKCINDDGQTGTGTGVKPPTIKGKCVAQLTECPADGDYHACTSCSQFVSCAPDGIFLRTCPAGTFWDDSSKQCELVSSTCS